MSAANSTSEDDDLRDASLRRALEHAPDHNAVPDWRMRKSILQNAHDAVVPPLEAGSADSARPWWQRMLGSGSGGRMPWNAAFATVLVATLVTVLWQREQVPGARLDSESSLATSGSAANAPAAPVTEAAAPSTPATPPAPEAPAPAAAAAPAPSADVAQAAPSESEPATTPPVAAFESPIRMPVPGLSPPSSASDDALARAARPPVEGRLPDFLREFPELPPLPAPPPPERGRNARESANATARLDDRLEKKRESRPVPAPPALESLQTSPSPSRLQPPAALPVPAPPAAIPPMAKAAPSAPSTNAAGSVGVGAASGAPAAAAKDRAAAQGPRTEATEPPKFSALSQWNRLTITPRGGTSVSLPRGGGTSELNALLGSAAISAVSARPFVGGAEFRVMLERNGEALAVFEVGQGQVRWREVGAPPATGAPTPAALAALREALKHAIRPPETRDPAAPGAGLVFAPQPVLPPAEPAPPIVAPSDVPSEAPRTP